MKTILAYIIIAIIAFSCVGQTAFAAKKSHGKIIKKKISQNYKHKYAKKSYKKHIKKQQKRYVKKRVSRLIVLKHKAKNKAQANKKIATLTKKYKTSGRMLIHESNRYGQMYIYSYCSGLDVYVDEDFAGNVPLGMRNLALGKHLVEVYMGKEVLYRQYIYSDGSGVPVVIEINDVKNIAGEDPSFRM